MPPAFSGAQEEEYVEFVIREVLPEAARLADAAYVFLERGSFEVLEARRHLEPCVRHGLALRLHADHRHPDWRYLAYHLGGDHFATRIKSGRLL